MLQLLPVQHSISHSRRLIRGSLSFFPLKKPARAKQAAFLPGEPLSGMLLCNKIKKKKNRQKSRLKKKENRMQMYNDEQSKTNPMQETDMVLSTVLIVK